MPPASNDAPPLKANNIRYLFTTLALHDGSVYKGTRNGGKKAEKTKTVVRLHETG